MDRFQCQEQIGSYKERVCSEWVNHLKIWVINLFENGSKMAFNVADVYCNKN